MKDRGYLRPGEQVTGLPEGLRTDFLSLPIAGAYYADGDVVPTVRPVYGTLSSGLHVPIEYARAPAPLDSVATYLTGAEVFGVSIPAAVTVDNLRRLPFAAILDFCAGLLRLVDLPGYTQGQVDSALSSLFVASVRRRIEAILGSGRRVLVAPHVTLELVKHAARLSGDCLIPGTVSGNAVCALLGTGDDLERLDEVVDDDEFVVGIGIPGRLEREVVSTHHFHRQTDIKHVLAKFVRRWRQLPVELSDDPRVVDLSSEFRSAVGVSLDSFIAAGMLLYSATIAQGPRLSRDALSQAGVDEADSERILRLVARTPADLRAWSRDSSSKPIWEFSYLERFPIVDFGDYLLVVRPGLLLQRFFGWLPIFDIEAGLGDGKSAGRRKGRIRSCLGHLGEVYAGETLQVQAQRHGLRLFTEPELRVALSPRNGQKTSDLTVDDGRRWAVFEMTSSQLTRESVASTSARNLDADFAKLLKKVRQLDATITSLRSRESMLTRQPTPRRPRKYLPVLVLTEGFPVNPVTLTMLRQRAEEAGLLQGADIGELEVVDVVELEMLEGAAFGEITILDALEAKAAAALHRSNLRDFLLREHRLQARTPDRIGELAQVAFEIAKHAARPPVADVA